MDDTIRLGATYVCDNAYYEIQETNFSREELHYNEMILEGEVESGYNKSECNKYTLHMTSLSLLNNQHNLTCLLIFF